MASCHLGGGGGGGCVLLPVIPSVVRLVENLGQWEEAKPWGWEWGGQSWMLPLFIIMKGTYSVRLSPNVKPNSCKFKGFSIVVQNCLRHRWLIKTVLLCSFQDIGSRQSGGLGGFSEKCLNEGWVESSSLLHKCELLYTCRGKVLTSDHSSWIVYRCTTSLLRLLSHY